MKELKNIIELDFFIYKFNLGILIKMTNVSIKCQKCRFELASNASSILDCHEKQIQNTARVTYSCNDNVMENNWYLSTTLLPDWINSSIEEVIINYLFGLLIEFVLYTNKY